MQKSVQPDASPVLIWGLAGIAAITLWRLILLQFNTTDLFVDEAQYWLWGQNIEAGYYSKPPLIGWVLGGVTALFGSDSPFVIRLPGPIFHAAAALALIAATREIADDTAAVATGIAYLSMPSVTLGSLLISTDTLMLPFYAIALLSYLKLCRGASFGWAVTLGLCLGLGMMAKYAAVYFLLGAGLAAVFMSEARIRLIDAGVAVIAFLLIFSPNIVWNIQNGLTTVTHTAENIDWVNDPSARAGLNFEGAITFFSAQFGVMGPVFFAAYLYFMVRTRRTDPWHRKWLIWMSLPILVLVTTQGLLSRAYANWAMPAHIAALMLAIPLLWHRARWIYWVGLVFNLALVVLLPVATTQATKITLPDSERLALRRYVGRANLSNEILAAAREAGATAVVTDRRDVLADLFYAARDGDIRPYAIPATGSPPHYYAQRFPYPSGRKEPLLFVALNDADLPGCIEKGTNPVATWPAGPGAHSGSVIRAYVAPADCWREGSTS